MKKVAVGSLNPVKLDAVRIAFERTWPNEEWHVTGVAVASGVSDQPMTAHESITGATARAHAARISIGADFGVGLEGGLQEYNGNWFDIGWAVVEGSDDAQGIAPSVGICIPEALMEKVRAGKEVGTACDEYFALKNSKQNSGSHGVLTNGTVTRTDAYVDAVACALSAFIHLELK